MTKLQREYLKWLNAHGRRITDTRMDIAGAFKPGKSVTSTEIADRVAPRPTRATVLRVCREMRDAGLIEGGGRVKTPGAPTAWIFPRAIKAQ